MSNPRSTIHDPRSTIPFTKMVGAGNDFLVIDAMHPPRGLRRRFGAVATSWSKVARAMCDRRYGIGADGILVLEPSKKADCRMRIFNPDGSEAQMCGNGARCVAAYLAGSGQRAAFRTAKRVTIETAGGLVSAQVSGTRVRMAMPAPRDLRLRVRVKLGGQSWPLGYVDTGVPHAVVSVRSVEDVNVQRTGRGLRFHPAFAPRGANVDFIEIKGANRLQIRTYERGVEGETLACGTGVAAAAVIHAATSNGHQPARASMRRIQVQTRSGETLTVSLRVSGTAAKPQVSDVVMEGQARWICQGSFPWSGRVS